MRDFTIWHNPRCSKSREALNILESKGADTVIIKYLEEKITAEMIEELLKKLGISAKELLRTKEEEYKGLGLKDETNEKKLIEAMVEHPKLIERPIVIKGDKAVLGRPPEKVLALFE
jgi:arsenate reductase